MSAVVWFFATIAALAVLFAFVHARISALEAEVARMQRRENVKRTLWLTAPTDYDASGDDHE